MPEGFLFAIIILMRILLTIGVLILLFACICLASLIHSNRTFVVRRYPYPTDLVDRRITLVFISDLHNKVYGDHNEAIYDAIRRIGPDAILIGGDMTIAKPAIHKAFAGDLSGMDEAITFLRELPTIATTYYVNGNHEQRIYETGTMGDEERYIAVRTMIHDFYKELDHLGIHQLHNSSALMADHVRLYGYEHACEHYEKIFSNPIPAGDLVAKLDQPDPRYLNILMAHNPKFYETYARWGADLVLSGHVHGGLMRIGRLGFIGPDLHLFPRYSGGDYYAFKGTGERAGRSDCARNPGAVSEMVLSCGLGAHTLPIRIFNPGEISVVEIEPQNM